MSLFKILPLLALFFSVGLVFSPVKASAIPNDYIIDDSVFLDSNSMTAGDIWNFLSQQGSGLRDISVVETEENYANYNKSVNVAQAIFDAGQAYGINPRVILATLQKEQSLITDPTPDSIQLRSAMGYGCPDSSDCNTAYAALFSQIDNGTWQLRLNRERAIGNQSWWNPNINYACPGSTRYYTPGLYPGNDVTFIDDDRVAYTKFVIATASTASLYCYTPHAYNNPTGAYGNPQWGTKGQYYSGSYNFWRYFSLWWGSTRANAFSYKFHSATTGAVHLQPGEKDSSTTIVLYNNGAENWYSDGNVPAGKKPTRLALANYRSTIYADTSSPNWLGTRNQVKMNQLVVAPGQWASFTIPLTAPENYLAKPEPLNFVPVVDGIGFMTNIDMVIWAAGVPPTYSFVSASGLKSSILPNEDVPVSVTIKNTSANTWYADGNIPSGKRATRLATKGYAPSSYVATNDASWLGTKNQVKMTPASVAPNQNATFTFKLTGPYSQYSEKLHFLPVLDGVAFMKDISLFAHISTPKPVNSYSFVTATNTPATMTKGSIATVSVTLKNTGNAVWRNHTKSGAYTTRLVMSKPDYRNSPFYNSADVSWLVPNQVRMNTAAVKPGENGVFSFTWKAPMTAGSYKESFRPAIDGYELMPDVGMQFNTTVTP